MSKLSPVFVSALAGLAAAGFAFVSAGAQDAPAPNVTPKKLSSAVFAGGCFWCVESDFDKLDGVVETISGYTGGHVDNPSYKQVVQETTGHYEAVKIVYDPAIVSYDKLVDYFFRHIDPLDAEGQFCDKGDSYRSAIFVETDAQKAAAKREIKDISDSGILGAPIVTKVIDASTFWPAEDYHQDYYRKSPVRYNLYRKACGRDERVDELWSKAES